MFRRAAAGLTTHADPGETVDITLMVATRSGAAFSSGPPTVPAEATDLRPLVKQFVTSGNPRSASPTPALLSSVDVVPERSFDSIFETGDVFKGPVGIDPADPPVIKMSVF